jgi:hypothetical protein
VIVLAGVCGQRRGCLGASYYLPEYSQCEYLMRILRACQTGSLVDSSIEDGLHRAFAGSQSTRGGPLAHAHRLTPAGRHEGRDGLLILRAAKG